MRIILVRHGEALRGTGERVHEDYGLTDRGNSQSHELANALSFPIDQIVTSPLPRAVQTGSIIAKHLKHETPLAIDVLSEIGERNDFEPEPLANFLMRAELAMEDLATLAGTRTILVVTHAGFIMASIRALFNIPTPGTGSRLEPGFASLTEWSKTGDTWELCYFNLHADNNHSS